MREHENEDTATVEDALRDLFDAEKDGSVPPSPDELEALVLGELSEQESDLVLERVALHPESMDELLELRRLQAPATNNEAGVDAVMASIEASEAISPSDSLRAFPAARPHRPRYPTWLAAAATVLFAISTLLVAFLWRENAELRSQLIDAGSVSSTGSSTTGAVGRALEGPRTDIRLFDLFPPAQLRGDEQVPTLQLQAQELVTLILTPGDPVPGRAYDVELLQDGRQIWSGGAEAEESGAVILLLGPERLKPGSWRVVLRAEQEETSFHLTISRPE